MRLALTMGRPLKALLLELDAEELVLWEAFAELEPFGPREEGYQRAALIAAVKNAWRGRGAPPVRPDEIFPWLRQRQGPQTDAEIRTVLDCCLPRK